MDTRGVKLTWLGHATFKIQTPGGKTVLLDPWVQGNPACPDNLKQFDKIDTMLITHGHFDHIGDAVALAKKHKPVVVCIPESKTSRHAPSGPRRKTFVVPVLSSRADISRPSLERIGNESCRSWHASVLLLRARMTVISPAVSKSSS